MLCCEAWAFPVGTATVISRPFFTPRIRRMRMNLDLWTLTTRIAAILFSLGRDVASRRVWLCENRRDVLCEFDYWSIGSKTVSMPLTKVCPLCKAAVPIRWKTCECCDLVVRSKRKADCNLRVKTMKRMGAVESDSVKSARKAKDKLHKPFKERQELVSEALHRQKQNRIRMASMRQSRDSDWFLVNTQVQSHVLLRRGFGTSVPFITFEYFWLLWHSAALCSTWSQMKELMN